METTAELPSWVKVWRDGFAPLLSDDALEALRYAVAEDDKRLTQGSTTTPPPLMCVQDFAVEGCCLIAYCGVELNGGFGAAKVGEVEEFFARACFEADRLLGEPAACRWLLNWWDDTPRPQALADLLPELDRELERRGLK